MWLLPWVFGPLALIGGGIAVAKRDRLGWFVIGLAPVCAAIGFVVYSLPAKLVGP